MKIPTCVVAEYLPVEKLKFHPDNESLRTITESRFEELKQSILKKGLYEPLLVWKMGNVVLSGNQRLKAIQALIEEGHTFVGADKKKKNMIPVVIEDVDDRRATEIVHQANNHQGDWVSENLAKALEEAKLIGWDTADLGFTDEEVDSIIMKTQVFEEEKESDSSEKNKEIPTENFGNDLRHTCPKCSFQFND